MYSNFTNFSLFLVDLWESDKTETNKNIEDNNNTEDNVGDDQYFRPLSESHINVWQFFKLHPKQPTENVPFKPSIFTSRITNTIRKRITFDSSDTRKLFCSTCLAFCGPTEKNTFTAGVNPVSSTNLLARILEHEKTQAHKNSSKAYFIHLKNQGIEAKINNDMMKKHEAQEAYRREILKRVIATIKFLALEIRSGGIEMKVP